MMQSPVEGDQQKDVANLIEHLGEGLQEVPELDTEAALLDGVGKGEHPVPLR